MAVLRDATAGILLLYCGSWLNLVLMKNGTPEAEARFYACLFVAVGGAIIIGARRRKPHA